MEIILFLKRKKIKKQFKHHGKKNFVKYRFPLYFLAFISTKKLEKHKLRVKSAYTGYFIPVQCSKVGLSDRLVHVFTKLRHILIHVFYNDIRKCGMYNHVNVRGNTFN